MITIGKQRWNSIGQGAAYRYYAFVLANIKDLALILGLGICAVLFGLLAATANPVMIGLGAGMVLGPLLLLTPAFTVWIILVVGLLFGVLSADPLLSKGVWVISLLNMLLLIPSLVNMLWGKHRRTPFFLWVALLFLLSAIASSIIQGHAIMEFVGGFKRYFQSFGLMMALTLIAFTPETYARWRKFLMIVALLQFPFALYELLVLVPLRGGLALSSETTDVIAGTFGANLEGGSPNSVMVIYLFIALSFLVAHWRAGLIDSKTFYPLVFICLLPLGMGETKIAVIMLPLVGLVLLQDDLIKAPLRFLFLVLIIILLTVILGYVYVSIIMHTDLDDFIYGTIQYNFGDRGYSDTQSLNRFTSITFWYQQQSWNDPVSFLIGNGLGSSYTTPEESAGYLGDKYGHYGIDLTAVSTLLWDTGLVGFILFMGIFITAWIAAGRLRRSVGDPAVKADALAIQAAIALFLLNMPYSDLNVNLIAMELIYAIVLGYLGYLMNHHGLLDRHSTFGLSSKSHD